MFSSNEDLYEGLREAIDRATAQALTPHVGIVGEFPPWLGPLIRRSARTLRLAGDPAAVQEAIDRDEALIAAQPRDLEEPLDLVIIVGLPPARAPRWLIEGRARFIAVSRREDFAAWLDRPKEDLDQGWFFVLEEHWSQLIGNRNGHGDDMTREHSGGDDTQ